MSSTSLTCTSQIQDYQGISVRESIAKSCGVILMSLCQKFNSYETDGNKMRTSRVGGITIEGHEWGNQLLSASEEASW